MTQSSQNNYTGSPLLTEAEVQHALGRLRQAFRERMQRDADDLMRVVSNHTDELLFAAYSEGVRDGFVQGAQTQARTETQGTEAGA